MNKVAVKSVMASAQERSAIVPQSTAAQLSDRKHSATPRLVISKRVDLKEVAWPRVLEQIERTFKVDFIVADSWLRDLIHRIRRPLHLAWFTGRMLAARDNVIIACVCEILGADEVVISSERSLHIATVEIVYAQELRFRPVIPKGALVKGGAVSASATLKFVGRRIVVQTLLGCLAVQAALFALGVLLYVLISGLFIYGLSVFLLFLHQPAAVLASAFRDPKIGLSLVGFMAACAAVSGRAIANLFSLATTQLRKWYGR